MSTCAIHPSARAVTVILSSTDSSVNEGTVSRQIYQLIDSGYMTAEEVEESTPYHLAAVIADMAADSLGVDVNFKERGAILVRSAEQFSGDGARSRYATNYIGYGTKGRRMAMEEAYVKGGRPLVDNLTSIGPDTVAVVEMTTSSDFLATWTACKRVLDAGGRLLLPTRAEVQQYADGIKSESNRKAYESLHRELESLFAKNGYSVRDSNEAGGRVVQKTGEVTIDKLSFASTTKAGKIKATSDSLSEEQVKSKVGEAKSWKISAGSTFESKEGGSLRAEGVTTPTLYDAIVAGEVDSIAKSDTKNNAYSALRPGEVLCLSKDGTHMVYVEVVGVTPNITKDQYVGMLRSGEATTGYSVESVAGMRQDALLSVVKIKPIAERTVTPKEGGKKDKGGKKSGKDHKGKIPVPRFSKKGHWYTEWVDAKDGGSKTSNGETSDIMRMMYNLSMAALTGQAKGGTVMFDDGTGPKEMPVEAVRSHIQEQYESSAKQDGQPAQAEKKSDAKTAKEISDAVSKDILHTDIKPEIKLRHSMQTDVFGGSYSLAEQFGKSLAGKFIERCEEIVLPKKIKQYKAAIEVCRRRLDDDTQSGHQRLARSERNTLRQKIKALNARIAAIEEDGWLAAVRIPDVLNTSVAEMLQVVREASLVSSEIDELRPKSKAKTLEELYTDFEKSENGREIKYEYRDLLDYDQREDGRKFLGAITDGCYDYTDAEWRAKLEAEGDIEGLAEWDSRTEEELREGREEDADIMRRRDMADILRADTVRLMLKELSDIVGVKLSYDTRVRTFDEEKEFEKTLYSVDAALESVSEREADESEEDAEASDDENDAETSEESGKDIQMTANYERDISDSLSKQVKRILGTQMEWWVKTTQLDGTAAERNTVALECEGYEDADVIRDENGDAVAVKDFYPVRDGVFRSPKRVSAGVVYNHLLRLVNGYGNVKGIYSGEELYRYLKENQSLLPWAHGIVKEMKKDAGVKTAMWVAMRNTHINMRSMNKGTIYSGRQNTTEWVSVAENYGESAQAMAAQAQTHMSTGTVLNRGVVESGGKPVRVDVSRTKGKPGQGGHYNIVGHDVTLHDMSVYDENGFLVQGKLEYEEDGKGGKTLKGASGGYALAFFMDNILEKLKKREFEDLVRARDPLIGDVVTALRAVGIDTTEAAVTSAFTLEPKKFKSCLLQLLRLANQSVDQFFAGNHDKLYGGAKPAYDWHSRDLIQLGEDISGLAESSVLSSVVWGARQYYSWAHRSYIDDLADGLGVKGYDRDKMQEMSKIERDRDVLPFISRLTGFDFEHPESSPDTFMVMRGTDGEPVVLNTILRDLMESQTKRGINGGMALDFREKFRENVFHSLGYKKDKSDVTDVKSMSVAEKVAIEIQAYFAPKHGDNKRMDGGYAQYAIPIMADSKNHIFSVGVRYEDNLDEGFGELVDHKQGSLLYDCTNVVLQEYLRIKAFKSNTIDGKQIARPELSKTYMKNAGRFCYFTSLNDVEVSIDGVRMSFVDALEALLGDFGVENESSSIVIHYEGRDYSVPLTAGVDLAHSLMMEAVQRTFLNESYHRSMDAWREAGVFKVDTYEVDGNKIEGYKYLAADTETSDPFRGAFKQHERRRQTREEATLAMIGREYAKVTGFRKTEDGGVKVLAERKNSGVVDEVSVSHRAWRELESYEDASRGIERGDLLKYFTEMGDELFLEYMYDMNCQERRREVERIKAIAAEVARVMGQYSGSKDDAFGKVVKSIGFVDDYDEAYNNLFVQYMHEYAWNKTLYKMEISQLLVGDAAQFKNEAELSKRAKGYAAAYERCDLSAVDTLGGTHKGKLVCNYYGEGLIFGKKYRENQKSLTVRDIKGGGEKAGRSSFFEKELHPLLVRDLEAGLITEQEYVDFCESFRDMNVTDGQSFRTLESMVKLLNFLHLNTPAIQAVYNVVVIEKRELTWDETRAAMQQIKSVAYGFQDTEIKYVEDGKVKTYKLRMVDFVKDSEFTLMMYTEQMARYLGDEVGRKAYKAGDESQKDYGGRRSILQGLLDFARENQVDVIHFESTKKTGESNMVDISDCETADDVYKKLTDAMNAAWTEEQKADKFFKRCKHDDRLFPRDPATDIFHAEPWSSMGRQVPTPPHLMDKEQGVGTQIDKLIEADIPDTWRAATSEVDPVTGKPVVKEFKTEVTLRGDDGKPVMRLSPEQFRDLTARIKLTNLLSAARKLEKKLDSKEELSKLLLDELRSTDKYSEDLVNMFSINPETGDFNMPLDNPVAIQAMQPIMASYIRKRVIKQKTKGGTAIQFSSVGKTKALKSVMGVDEKTGREYVKYVECMLPAWSKALFTAFADENGEIDIDKIPPSLTSMVGYRVPTEHMYSMVPLRVIGFLNEAQGTSIMLPQEITVWSGSDFDIDKLYLEIPEFKVKGRNEVLNIASKKAWDGFYKERPDVWSAIMEGWRNAAAQFLENNSGVLDEGTRAELQAIIDDPASAPAKAFKSFREQYCVSAGKGKGRMSDVLAIHYPEEYARLRDLFDEYLEKNGMLEEYVETEGDCTKKLMSLVDEEGHLVKEGAGIQSLLDGMSQMERNNLLVKLHHSRLTSDFSLMQINRPGGFTAQKRMARMVTVLQNSDLQYGDLAKMSLDELGNLSDEYNGDLHMFDAAVDDMMFERNMIGSSMIGICALHNTLHAVVQKKPIELSKDFVKTYGFTLNGKEMRTRLGDVEDENGKSILLNIGGFLSASVDNAKDPVLGFLNMTPTTADVFLSFLHMGYSIETASLLMNQPIIKAASKLGNRFEYHIGRLCRDGEIHGITGKDDSVLNMTHEAMAASLSLKGGEAELLRDPVQRNALYIVNAMLKVANAIKTLQEANNVTSSNKSLAATPGESIRRMSPALYAAGRNDCIVMGDNGGTAYGHVFGDEYYSFLRDDTSTTGELHDVEYYMQAKADGRMSQPFVQACYDVGFRWAMDKLSRYSSQYSRDVIDVVDALNRKFGNDDSIRLKDSFINRIVRELRTFRTIDAFAAEELRKGYTVQQARAVFLRDFPKQYSKIMNKYRKEHNRDLQKEFAILGHIVNAKAKNDKAAYLKFTANGKVDKGLQNDLTSSWNSLATSQDDELRQLAINLYKYAFYFNGGNFSPIAFGSYCPAEVLSQFREYNDRLRELPEKKMSVYGDYNGFGNADEVDRFVDQFIRNHTNLKQVKDIIGKFICPYAEKGKGDLRDEFFKKEEVNGRTKYVPRKSFSFTFKNPKAGGMDYVMIYLGKESFLFRKVGENSDGTSKYVKADVLGDNNSCEYDPESDLCEHVSSYGPVATGGPVTENGALGMSKGQAEEQRRYGEEALAKLKEINSRLTDNRSGKGGNDSDGYKLDGKEGMRVHQYMENKLGCKGVSKPDAYTDEEWERVKADGTAIGSAVDFYGRTYLDLLTQGEPLEMGHFSIISRYDKLDETRLGKEDRDRLALIFTRLGDLWKAGIDTRLDTSFNGRLRTKREFMDGKFHHVLRALRESHVLEPGDRIIEGFRYKGEDGKETVKSIRLFANVATASGERLSIGGEVDWLIAHADGSFSILDLKTVKDTSVSYLTDPTGSTYQAYAKQLNTYRSLLLAMFPKAKVRGLYIVPFVTSRTVTDANGKDIGGYNKRVPDASKGERTLLTDIQNLDEYENMGLPYIEVPMDEKLSGIPDPKEVAPAVATAAPAAQAKPASSQGAPTVKASAPAARMATQPKTYQVNEETRQNIMDQIEIGMMSKEEAMRDFPEFFYDEKVISVVKKALELGTRTPDAIEAKFPGLLALINGESTEAAEPAQESAPAAGQAQGDGFNSYRGILVAALGEEATNMIYDEYSILDGVPSPADIEDMNTGDKTKEQLVQYVLDIRAGLNKKGRPYIATALKSANTNGRFNDILSKGDDFFIQLGEAIRNHKRVKDDEGNTLC